MGNPAGERPCVSGDPLRGVAAAGPLAGIDFRDGGVGFRPSFFRAAGSAATAMALRQRQLAVRRDAGWACDGIRIRGASARPASAGAGRRRLRGVGVVLRAALGTRFLMAALVAILKAVRRAVGRDLGTLQSIKVNNLFLFVALLSYGALNSGQPPKSSYPFFVLLGFLLLFPLSSDPLGKIPPARLRLWPLTAGQRLGLRFASLAFSPVAWIGVLILLKTARPLTALAFFGLAAGIQAAMALGRRAATRNPHWDLLRYIPQFPG